MRRLILVLLLLSTTAGFVFAQAESDDEIVLDDTILFVDEFGGELTIYYPDDWLASTNRTEVILSNSRDNLIEVNTSPEDDQFQMLVISGPFQRLEQFLGDTEVSTLALTQGAVNLILNNWFPEDATAKLGEGTELDMENVTGAYVAGNVSGPDVDTDLLVMTVEIPNSRSYVALVLLTPTGDVGDYFTIMQAMADQLEYIAPDDGVLDLNNEISVVDNLGGMLIVQYPDEWVARSADGILTLADSRETLNRDDFLFEEGEFQVTMLAAAPLVMAALGVRIDSEPGDLAQATCDLLMQGAESDVAFEFDVPERFTMGPRSGALLVARDPMGLVEVTVFNLEAPRGSRTRMVALLVTGNGESQAYVETIKAMLAAAEYTR